MKTIKKAINTMLKRISRKDKKESTYTEKISTLKYEIVQKIEDKVRKAKGQRIKLDNFSIYVDIEIHNDRYLVLHDKSGYILY